MLRCSSALIVCIRFIIHTPPPGGAVAVLDMVMVMITIREMPYIYKCAWLFAAFWLMLIELRAINKDRLDNQVAQNLFRYFRTVVETA